MRARGSDTHDAFRCWTNDTNTRAEKVGLSPKAPEGAGGLGNKSLNGTNERTTTNEHPDPFNLHAHTLHARGPRFAPPGVRYYEGKRHTEKTEGEGTETRNYDKDSDHITKRRITEGSMRRVALHPRGKNNRRGLPRVLIPADRSFARWARILLW